jgi:hypothetical protein
MLESQLTACMARFWFLRKVESCEGASFETFGALFGVCPVVVVESFEASFCERDIDLANRGLWREMKGEEGLSYQRCYFQCRKQMRSQAGRR